MVLMTILLRIGNVCFKIHLNSWHKLKWNPIPNQWYKFDFISKDGGYTVYLNDYWVLAQLVRALH